MADVAARTGETTVPATDTSVLLAIGLPMGAEVLKTDLDRPPRAGIRRGGEWYSVPVEAWELWVQTFYPRTTEDLARYSTEHHRPDPIADEIAAMEEWGLVVRWSPQVSINVFRSLRVIPLAVGGGNSVDDPDRFQILSPTAQAVMVTTDLVGFVLWSFYDGYTSLYDACKRTAKHLGLPFEEVADKARRSIPVLMSVRAIYLDAIPGQAS